MSDFLLIYAAMCCSCAVGYLVGTRIQIARSLSPTDPDVLWKIAQSYQAEWRRREKAAEHKETASAESTPPLPPERP